MVRPLPVSSLTLRRARGFTLIEVMVSLFLLAILATAAWRGVDAITTARQIADGHLKQTLRLQAVMTQFDADLGQVLATKIIPGLQFDGAHLRITRRSATGMQVVVWYVSQNRLLRWASPEASRVGDLEKYWYASYQLRGREPGTLVALKGVEQWQLFCWRRGALSNCQSTGDLSGARSSANAAAAAAGLTGNGGAPALGRVGAGTFLEQVPQAIRCQMTLGEGSGFAGRLQREVPVAPDFWGSPL